MLVDYGTRSLLKLQAVLCASCANRPLPWTDHVYSEWLRYLDGCPPNRKTRKTLQYHFRKHPCYPKIAHIRKKFRKIKTVLEQPVAEHPWLLGLYYADGCIRNRSQLSFALSMHEEHIEKRVCEELKNLTSKESTIRTEFIGNMRQIRIHSTELCDAFPRKYPPQDFTSLWNQFTQSQKLQFIAGFIDGDGSCAFDVELTSIQIYSKDMCFILKTIHEFLSHFGHNTLLRDGHLLYISPQLGLFLKPYLVKKDVKRPYHGSVDVKQAFALLKQGKSIYKIAQETGFDKKTVNLALRQVYGYSHIKQFFKRRNHAHHTAKSELTRYI